MGGMLGRSEGSPGSDDGIFLHGVLLTRMWSFSEVCSAVTHDLITFLYVYCTSSKKKKT